MPPTARQPTKPAKPSKSQPSPVNQRGQPLDDAGLIRIYIQCTTTPIPDFLAIGLRNHMHTHTSPLNSRPGFALIFFTTSILYFSSIFVHLHSRFFCHLQPAGRTTQLFFSLCLPLSISRAASPPSKQPQEESLTNDPTIRPSRVSCAAPRLLLRPRHSPLSTSQT